MPSSGDIRFGGGYVELGLDDGQLRHGMAGVESKLESFAGNLKSVAAAVGFGALAASIKGMVSSYVDAAEEMYKAAQKNGTTIADLDAKAAKAGFGGFEGLAQAHELAAAFEELKKAADVTYNTIAGALAPAFSSFIKVMTTAQEAITKFVEENKTAIQIAGTFAAVGVVVASALAGITAAFALVNVAIGAIVAPFALVAGLLGAIFTPMGAFALVVGGLVYQFTNLGSVFGRMGAAIANAWGGISDALSAGNLALAWEVASAHISAVWANTVVDLMDRWANFKSWFEQTFGISTNTIFTGLRVAWIETIAFMKKRWLDMQDVFAAIQNVGNEAGYNNAHARIMNDFQEGRMDERQMRAEIGALRRERQIELAGGQEAWNRRQRQRQDIEDARIDGRRDAAVDHAANDHALGLQFGAPQWARDDAAIQNVNAANASMIANMAARFGLTDRQNQYLAGITGDLDVKAMGTFSATAASNIGSSPLARLQTAAEEQNRRLDVLNNHMARVLPLVVGG